MKFAKLSNDIHLFSFFPLKTVCFSPKIHFYWFARWHRFLFTHFSSDIEPAKKMFGNRLNTCCVHDPFPTHFPTQNV